MRRPGQRRWTDLLPVPVVVTLVLIRELIRVCGVPFHGVFYLLRRKAHLARAKDALERGPDLSSDPVSDFLKDFLQQPRPPEATPHLFVSCGEASGERHLNGVLQATTAGNLQVRITGFGAAVVARHGTLMFPLAEHGIIGFGGVLRALPRILQAFSRYVRLLRQDTPDLILLLDYPGLHMVMGQYARRRGIPVIHYVVPQHWAWAPWRIHRYARCVDLALTIFPFEVPILSKASVRAAYVGHPLLDDKPTAPEQRRTNNDPPKLLLMPGHRRGELAAHLPAFVRIAQNLRSRIPGLNVHLAQTDPDRVPLIRSLLTAHNGDFVSVVAGPLHAAVATVDVVLVKSGTGSLEVALLGTPNVIAYSLQSWFMRKIAINFLAVPWFGAANLIAGRTVVDEFGVRSDADWILVENAVFSLLTDPEIQAKSRNDLADVRTRLGSSGASTRVADVLLRFFALSESHGS